MATTAARNYTGAPFLKQTPRFVQGGLDARVKHPDSVNRSVGPGSYDTQSFGDSFSQRNVERRAERPGGWQRSLHLERQGKIPHLLFKEEWKRRKGQAAKVGPGSYDYEDFLLSQNRKPQSDRGPINTLARRFHTAGEKNAVPAPGTYGYPNEQLEAKEKKAASTVGSFDAKSCFPRSLPSVGSHLAPGSYETHASIDDMLTRRVGKRGPYDLFTADRGAPINTGHLADPKANTALAPGRYDLEQYTNLKELFHRDKRYHGRFSTITQYPAKPTDRIGVDSLNQWPREPKDPAPGDYSTDKPEWPEVTHNMVRGGFNVTQPRDDRRSQKFFTGNHNPVGAGRYDPIKVVAAVKGHGHLSSFLSSDPRLTHDQEKSLRERLRGNVKVTQQTDTAQKNLAARHHTEATRAYDRIAGTA